MKYIEVIKTSILISLMYKKNLWTTSLIECFKFVAEYVFWWVVYIAGNGNNLFGYTFDSMISYYIFMFIVGSLTSMGNVGYKIAEDIKNGTLTNLLIKPIGCLKFYFCDSIGKKLPQMLVSIIFFIPIFIYFRDFLVYTDNLYIFFLFIISLILAVILTFSVNVLFSLMVFWLTEISGFFLMKDFILNMLSGGIFPINIMPLAFFSAMKFLPFLYCTYFPVSILIESQSMTNILKGLFSGIIWVAVLLIAIEVIWQKGLKKYEGTGM